MGEGEEVVGVGEEECTMHDTRARGGTKTEVCLLLRTEVCLLLPVPRAHSVAGLRGACFGSRLMRMVPELVVRLKLVLLLVARQSL
jgi:hypothetical protein